LQAKITSKALMACKNTFIGFTTRYRYMEISIICEITYFTRNNQYSLSV